MSIVGNMVTYWHPGSEGLVPLPAIVCGEYGPGELRLWTPARIDPDQGYMVDAVYVEGCLQSTGPTANRWTPVEPLPS